MGYLHKNLFPSKFDALKASKNDAISFLIEPLLQKLNDYITPDESHVNAFNKESEYGEEDGVATIGSVEIEDKPQFEEKKLYENSTTKKIQDKKIAYTMLSNVITYMDFTDQLAKNEVLVHVIKSDRNDTFSPDNIEHLDTMNELIFYNSVDGYVRKHNISDVNSSVYKNSKRTLADILPNEKDLHQYINIFDSIIKPEENIAASKDRY